MIASAKASGISEISITEHVSQFKELRELVEFRSMHSDGRVFANFAEYEDEFRRLNSELASGLKINRGLEVDFSPRFESFVSDFVKRRTWDILLCSVHEFEDGKPIDDEFVVDPASSKELWRDYFRVQNLALESDFVPFRVLAHPVRLSKVLPISPLELDDLLLSLARTAKCTGKALELNGNDINFAPELVRHLAIACSKADCKVSLGSDGHFPAEVSRNFRIAKGLMDEFSLAIC